jgi:hypothetical protein
MKNAAWSILLTSVIFSCSFNNETKKVEAQKRLLVKKTITAEKLDKFEQRPNDILVAKLKAFDQEVKIGMFKEMRLMSQTQFELKYPFENFSSTHAYSNEDGTVTLLISPREEKADQKDLPNYQQTFTANFANNPSIDFKRCEIKKIGNRDFIIVEMITPAVDSQIYNLMYVTSVEGKLLVCTFNCTIDKLAEWQPIGEKMLNSITINNL